MERGPRPTSKHQSRHSAFEEILQSSMGRREFCRWAGLGLFGASASGWLPAMAEQLAADPRRRRQCILLWMNGGPSQLDTFDLKPGHPNGGEFKEIATSVPGLSISEHLPKLAEHAEHLAILRGVSTKEGDHSRATHLMRTGHLPGGPVRYPSMGSLLSKELGRDDSELPNYVSIAPYQAFSPAAYGPGFLGPAYAPASVGVSSAIRPDGAGDETDANAYARLGVDYLRLPRGVTNDQADGRLELWNSLQDRFLADRPSSSAAAHDTVYRRAVRVMRSDAKKAFDVTHEPDNIRDAYGRGRFGQGCLIARRLIERGVPFVEVSLGGFDNGGIGWDTHQNNFTTVKGLSEELDAGWGNLMRELKERSLLESTTMVWMGEFGRTPTINAMGGRDHFPNAWTCVLAGGGIQGGQAYGKTSADGMSVEKGKVDVGDILATLCKALGIDPETQNEAGLGRPIRLSEGTPIADVLA